MKKLIIILMILLVTLPVIAEIELSLGPAAFLEFPIPLKALDQVGYAVTHFGIEDFNFGADLELILGLLQLGAIATYTPSAEWIADDPDLGDVTVQRPGFITLAADGGVLFEALFLRFGVGAGPTLRIPVVYERPDRPVDFGINIKVNIDFDLSFVAIRLNISTFADFIEMAKEEGGLGALPVYLGASLLFDL